MGFKMQEFDKNIKKDFGTSKRGAISELVASNWLLMQGYEVFRNLTPSGKADIIAIKDGETLYIDVGTAQRKLNGYISDPKERFVGNKVGDFEIKFLYVVAEDNSCVWRDDVYDPGVVKKCVWCKELFRTRKHNKKTCTKECSEAFQAWRNEKKRSQKKLAKPVKC